VSDRLASGRADRHNPEQPKREGSVDKRTLGIILTLVTSLLCACPGLALCLAGGITAAGYGNYYADLQGRSGTLPTGYGFGMLCLGLLLVAIPIVIGVLMLRKPKTAASSVDPAPPAS
jgi:hypothetical protein